MSDPYDGQWRMSGEYLADDVPTTHNKHRLVHLSWNHSGSELAILDVVGQVSVYAVINAINRLVLLRRCTPDSEDHLSAAVGMTWLHIDKPVKTNLFTAMRPADSPSVRAVLFPQPYGQS